MIWRLLKKNISVAQILGYSVASLVGLWIIVCAIQFYGDASKVLGNDEDGLPSDYLVISKQVSMLNTLGLGNATTAISPEEIADLEAQPWVKEVGAFTSANFGVAAAVDMDGRGMSTYLFLESVPEQFLDVVPEQWKWEPSNPNASVPIIISKDYLALYNFGFAASRGLPQLSEGLISRVPITLYLSGNGHRDAMKANIVGFSNRLNTIAVPESFMDWANNKYSTQLEPDPSRLIIQVSDPGNPEIEKYLKQNGYEAAGEGMNHGKAQFFLTILTTVVTTVGAIICALALFILMLSITLLMQRNREKNRALLLLGYAPSQVAGGYYTFVVLMNATIYVLTIVGLFLVKGYWQSMLSEAGLASASPFPSLLWGLAIISVVTIINLLTIRHHIYNGINGNK